MVKLFYIEIICDRTKDYLDEDENNLKKWIKWVDFDYIGLVEDALGNPDVIEWIKMIHKLYPKKKIIYISDGKKFLEDDKFIGELVLYSPVKICIVLPDEKEEAFLNDFILMLKKTKFRFLKSGNNAIDGYRFRLLDKKHDLDIELYKHVPTNQKEQCDSQDYLQMLGAKDLFKYTNRRKFMPLLRNERLFKCRYAYMLWEFWENNQNKLEKYTNYISLYNTYRRIEEKNVFQNPEQFIVEHNFFKESELCSMCPGCVECVVHLKLNMNK